MHADPLAGLVGLLVAIWFAKYFLRALWGCLWLPVDLVKAIFQLRARLAARLEAEGARQWMK
jgi:lauroyl/myristoyl acyltransferase